MLVSLFPLLPIGTFFYFRLVRDCVPSIVVKKKATETQGRAGQPTANTPSASADANAVLRNIIGVAQRAQIAQIAQITQQVQLRV